MSSTITNVILVKIIRARSRGHRSMTTHRVRGAFHSCRMLQIKSCHFKSDAKQVTSRDTEAVRQATVLPLAN